MQESGASGCAKARQVRAIPFALWKLVSTRNWGGASTPAAGVLSVGTRVYLKVWDGPSRCAGVQRKHTAAEGAVA